LARPKPASPPWSSADTWAVNDDTALLLHNKNLRAMTKREEAYLLRGKIQIDDGYLGEHTFARISG
jgi:hypothetical protein